MSRSVHTSRAKFRNAARFDYSSDEERSRVLGKIIDEKFLKRDLKEKAKRQKQAKKAGLKTISPVGEINAMRWKKLPPSDVAKKIVQAHIRSGYVRTRSK